MTRTKRRLPGGLRIMVGAIVLGWGSNPAQAQWDMGLGFGGFGFHNAPSPTNFLNQHSLTNSARGAQGVPSRTPYGNSSNAYFNRIRDNGFVSHQDVRRRRRPTYQPESTASSGNAGGAEPQPAPAANPVAPLGSFFDAARKFVWPNDAPTHGDLQGKRDMSDEAILAVLEETKQQSTASITSVAYARQKLLDYGQPALQEVRTQATPPIADTFHRFLLSIYESLAQAASPPESVSGNPPKP